MQRFLRSFALFMFSAVLSSACAAEAQDGVYDLQQGIARPFGEIVLLARNIRVSATPPEAFIVVHSERGSGEVYLTQGSFNLLRLGDDDYAAVLVAVEKGSPDMAKVRLTKRDKSVSWSGWISSLGK